MGTGSVAQRGSGGSSELIQLGTGAIFQAKSSYTALVWLPSPMAPTET